MPELHALTPSLGVLQKRGLPGRAGHRRPHVRRVRQHPRRHPRDARVGRTAGRSPGCATATSCGSTPTPARWTCWWIRPSGRPSGRRRRRTRTPSAPAASCSPAFRHAVGRADQGAHVFGPAPHRPHPPAGDPMTAVSDPPADRRGPRWPSAPSCPWSSSTTSTQAVPLARALPRGGVGIIEITLRTAAGLGAIERVAAEVPEMRHRCRHGDHSGGGRGRTSRRGPVHRHARAHRPGCCEAVLRHRAPAAGRLVHAHRDDARWPSTGSRR